MACGHLSEYPKPFHRLYKPQYAPDRMICSIFPKKYLDQVTKSENLDLMLANAFSESISAFSIFLRRILNRVMDPLMSCLSLSLSVLPIEPLRRSNRIWPTSWSTNLSSYDKFQNYIEFQEVALVVGKPH